jgi:hypothetical protein
VRQLDWGPADTILTLWGGDVIMAIRHKEGERLITPRGFLRLPVVVRRRLHLSGGERVVVGTDPDADLLMVFAVSTLDRMVHRLCAATLTGAHDGCR